MVVSKSTLLSNNRLKNSRNVCEFSHSMKEMLHLQMSWRCSKVWLLSMYQKQLTTSLFSLKNLNKIKLSQSHLYGKKMQIMLPPHTFSVFLIFLLVVWLLVGRSWVQYNIELDSKFGFSKTFKHERSGLQIYLLTELLSAHSGSRHPSILFHLPSPSLVAWPVDRAEVSEQKALFMWEAWVLWAVAMGS